MRRILAAAIAVALVGLGVLIHVGTPPSPRWTVRPELSADLMTRLVGDRLITVPTSEVVERGPVEVRDVTTGGLLFRAWEDAARAFSFWISDNGAVAVSVIDGRDGRLLAWLDLATGDRGESPLGRGEWLIPFTSPDAEFVFAEEFGPDETTTRVRGVNRRTGQAVGPWTRSAAGGRGWTGGRLLLPRADGTGLDVVDPAVGRVSTIPVRAMECFGSPDGRRAFVTTGTGLEVWAIDGPPRRLASFPSEHSARVRFVPGGPAFVVFDGVGPGFPLIVLDPETGREMWRYPLGSTFHISTLLPSPNGRLFAAGGQTLRVLDVAEKAVVWSEGRACQALFSPDGATVLTFRDRPAVTFHDARTGRESGMIDLARWERHDAGFHAGGRQLWVTAAGGAGPPDTWLTRALAWVRRPVPKDETGLLLGVEWPSRRELLRLTDRGVTAFHVADDGSFVITVDAAAVRRWDVPQPRPWASSVGVPVALGALIVALGWMCRREGP